MVSKKELEYVDQYARNVPFPGVSYARAAVELMVNAYETYKLNYQGKSYNFIFSDGEEISFQILDKNLAHLFGIDYQNLISDPMKATIERTIGINDYLRGGACEFLKRIIDNADDVIKNDSDPRNYRMLNYYRILIKCSAFSKLSTFEKFNFGCLRFNKEIYENLIGKEFTPKSNMFFFTPSNEVVTPHFMMGIKKDSYSNSYIPETIFAPSDFFKMIENQTFVLPIQVLINDNCDLKKITAGSEEKLELLNLYKSLIGMYRTNTFIEIYSDYENVLRDNKELLLKK